ncbi:hypothetical protein E8E14_008342 [Neopestalotiopsis sp. 37M]|nr:hypothetical protein E8E14_008342 [Neopestalotiopsis sp. 37M]
MERQYKFTAIPGVFEDHAEIAKSAPDKMVRTQPNLGLLHQTYASDSSDHAQNSQWKKFARYLALLNKSCPDDTSYKLIYLIRHGSSVHNEVMKVVGDDWRRTGPKWAFQEGGDIPGMGKVTWVDAKLVKAGVAHAEALSKFLLQATKHEDMPLPGTIYTSPLARGLETTKLTYKDVMGAHQQPFQPVIKEFLRERLTGHTCDKRSSRTWIAENYPDYIIEDGFEESDRLWEEKRNPAEEPSEVTAREQRLLEDIFANDSSQVISLTTHSYSISGIQEAIGSKSYRVGEGVMVPLLVQAVKL